MSSEHQAKLVKLIQQAGSRYDSWKVFSDFALMLACDISTHCDLRTSDEREEQYKKTIAGYDKETQKLFPEMCAELVLALTDGAIAGHYDDVLGQTFHDLGVENKWKGQFFTPIHVSDVMAELSFEGFEKNIEGKGFASVYEPACGAGSTILGFLNAFRKMYPDKGFDTFVVHAGDVDERCVHMCATSSSRCAVSRPSSNSATRFRWSSRAASGTHPSTSTRVGSGANFQHTTKRRKKSCHEVFRRYPTCREI